jgi:molybdate transport system substrate-binding protein
MNPPRVRILHLAAGAAPTVSRIAWASVPAACIPALMLFGMMAAGAADLKLIGAVPMSGVVKELGAQFERETNHKLIAKFVSGPIVKREIDAGETFDVAVSITPVIDALIKDDKILGGTRVDVAYVGVGLAVRRGTPKPDIGSVEAFKRTLLNAKSVAYSAEGVAGTYFRALLERLGISEEMKTKLRQSGSGGAAVEAVAAGEAEMGVVAISNIVEFGADLVGPLPSELQSYIAFAAGVITRAKEPGAAKALVNLLTASAAITVIKAKGMEPGVPR